MLIVLFGSFAAKVDASCGDYLHRNTATESDGSVGAEMDSTNRGQASEPPCSGPTCRRAPETPARSIPAEDRASNIERPVLLPIATFAGDGESTQLRPGNLALKLEKHRRDLDRPPRSC